MATPLRVYEIPVPTKADPRPAPEEIHTFAGVAIDASGDAAKPLARDIMRDRGYGVRAMSWSPDPRPERPAVLIVYVTKKG